jgi:hypothetical protein
MRRTRENDAVRSTTGAGTSVKDGDLATPMRLRDFMSQLGVVMQLPARVPEAQPVPQAVGTPTPSRRVRARLAIPVAAVLAVSAFSLSRLAPPPPPVMPTEVLGTWTTSEGSYAGKRLVLAARTVQMLNGDKPITSAQAIRAVSVQRRLDTVAVLVTHDADGGATELAAAWTNQGGLERLTLKHPAGFSWRRLQDSVNAPATAAQARAGNAAAIPRPANPAGIPGPGKKPWER